MIREACQLAPARCVNKDGTASCLQEPVIRPAGVQQSSPVHHIGMKLSRWAKACAGQCLKLRLAVSSLPAVSNCPIA